MSQKQLVITTQGRFDELELLFSEDLSGIQETLERALDKVTGVERAEVYRYSASLWIAPHIAAVDDVVTDALKVFGQGPIVSHLKSLGVEKVRVNRLEGERQFRSLGSRETELL